MQNEDKPGSLVYQECPPDPGRSMWAVLDAVPYPLYVIDADTYELQLANARARASGRPAFCRGAVSPDEGGQGKQFQADSLLGEVKRNKTRVIIEHVEYSPSGSATIYEISICPVLNKDGKVTQIIECALEVTSRARTQQALQASESRLRQVVESLPVVLMSHDTAGRPTLVTGAVREILGYEASQFMEDRELLMKIIHPQDSALALQMIKRCVGENRQFEMDLRIVHGTEHRPVWVHCKAVPILDEEGHVLRVDGILVDKTEERRTVDEREQLEARLQQTERLESLGVLAGGIAHDFNNLLTIIGGNAQFLRETAALDAAQSKALGDVETATRNASDMVRSLQAFSRPSKPQMVVSDANVLTQDIYRLLRRLMPARIDFQFRPHRGPCHVAADTGQIQQILTSLCLNAREAGPDRIELTTAIVTAAQLPSTIRGQADRPGYVEIAVGDNGRGMDEETLRRAFDPFFTTKPKEQGTGLGLAIVYRVVQAHGGMIDVVSAPGEGSRFKIFLPQVSSPSPDTSERDGPLAKGTEHILVVDDEPMIASLIRTILETAGYHVDIAHHPADALRVAAERDAQANLAVIDYELPGMAGPECLTALRRRWPALKCIMITGHQVDGLDLEATGVRLLTKPFSSHVIAQMVREVLDQRTD